MSYERFSDMSLARQRAFLDQLQADQRELHRKIHGQWPHLLGPPEEDPVIEELEQEFE